MSAGLFRLLADDGRLRLLRLLDRERLNVTELTSVLGIAQSGVSRHLGLLKDAGLVVEERDAGFSYYRVAPALRDGHNGFGSLWPVLGEQFAALGKTPGGRADDARLEEVRRVRRENFEVHGGGSGERRQLVPGRSWAAWARALGHLLPPLRVADIGCGEGYLAIEAAQFATRVVAIDHSAPVLTRARELARRRGVTNIVWRRGQIEKLPLRNESMDVALLSQALHHAADPARALAEAARVVVPGGRVLILDLRRHDEHWTRERLGDRWPGFEPAELRRLLTDAGLEHVKVTTGSRRTGDPFAVLVASGTKPAATRRTERRTKSSRRTTT
ncbi:MAG TPA: metalloregulator ArsR/SmtB family transcription factor [Vicinamibacterales bacterium]|nr:metalloregulator ArsR/SmtB family transcription factor [Vicinamibacterales bacterium]